MTNEITRDDLMLHIEELKKLVRINGIINATLDIGKLLKLIMEVIKDIMKTEASSMLLYDEEHHDLVFKVALSEVENELVEKFRLDIGKGIAGWVAENRKTAYVNDAYKDERFDDTVDRQTGFTTRSLVCAPLLFKGKLLGVIQAINPLERENFDDHDLELFSVFADQASLAVQNAIFFQDALDEARIKTELQAARTIHDTSLKPASFSDETLSFAARSIHSREVSGVLHGVVNNARTLMYYVGDVHTRGIPGGLKAARMDGLIRGFLSGTHADIRAVADTFRKTIREGFLEEGILSLFLGEFDRHEKVCRYVYGGEMHIFRVRGESVKYIQTGQIDFADKGSSFKLVTVTLEPGDFLAVLSPRFLKAKDPNGTRIAPEQLTPMIREGATPDEKLDLLIGMINRFTGGYSSRSDYSVAVLGITR